MRKKTKSIILMTGLCAYMMIKEALNLEKRHNELNAYEEGVNSVVDKVNEGIEVDKVININLVK